LIVRRPENLPRRRAFLHRHYLEQLDETRPELWIGEIGRRLGPRAYAIKRLGLADAETAKLREDEPHPVTPLPPRPQLLASAIEHPFLRALESRQIERIHVGLALQRRRAAAKASRPPRSFPS
jgi:hypothetical protein